MPLPQKVIEQLGREPPKTPGWSGRLLMFSGTIFFITLSTYVGLAFGYTRYLNGQIAQINEDIDRFGEEVSVEDQLKLASFYSQLGNIKSLLSSQVVGLRAFEWIEKNTQVNSYIRNLSVNFVGGNLSYGISAATIEDALQQMAWLQRRPEIGSAGNAGIGGLSSVPAGAGTEWQFNVQLALDKSYFSRSYEAGRNATTTP